MNIADVYLNRQPDIMDLKIGDIVYVAEDPYKVLQSNTPYLVAQIPSQCLIYRGGELCGSSIFEFKCRYGGYNFDVIDVRSERGKRLGCVCEIVNERGIPYKRRH